MWKIVKAINKEEDGFLYFKTVFSKFSDVPLNDGIFVEPNFDKRLRNYSGLSLKTVLKGYLGNNRTENAE